MKIIRWGILGLGNIAEKFASDLLLVPHCVLQAVASQRKNHAALFAKKFNALSFYDQYITLIEDNQVDVIYIATLHPSHAQWSIEALNRKKAVLCEKPLAMNSSQVSKIITTAQNNNTFLMEALWTRFNPLFEHVLKWIEEGQIGNIRYIQASFSFFGLDRLLDSRILDPNKGGGSLLDIGIYPLFLTYQLLGMPEKIIANSILSEQHIDLQTAMMLSYKESQAMLYSGITHDEDMGAKICGEKGEIYLPSRWHNANRAVLRQGEKEDQIEYPFVGLGYSYEIEETNQCLREKLLQSKKWRHCDSAQLMFLLDEIRNEAGIFYPDQEI